MSFILLVELSRYWKSKFNIILAAALLLVVIFITWQNYSEKLDFEQHLSNALASPLSEMGDIEYLTLMVEGYTGAFLYESLFFRSTDFYAIFWITLMIGMGIFIGPRTFSALASGHGVMIMSRTKYSDYIRKTLLAQFIYMATFMVLIHFVVFVGLILLGGGGLQVPIISRTGGIWRDGVQPLTAVQYFATLFGLTIYSIICMIPLIIISSLSPVFLKNKYIIQFVPFAFLVGFYVLAFILGNLSGLLALVMRGFIFENALSSLTGLISPYVTGIYGGRIYYWLIYVILYPAGLWVLSVILFINNNNKFGKDYLR